jgi:hypothetical protein
VAGGHLFVPCEGDHEPEGCKWASAWILLSEDGMQGSGGLALCRCVHAGGECYSCLLWLCLCCEFCGAMVAALLLLQGSSES